MGTKSPSGLSALAPALIPSLPRYLLASSLHDMTLRGFTHSSRLGKMKQPLGVLQNISKTQRSAVFQEECQVADNLLADQKSEVIQESTIAPRRSLVWEHVLTPTPKT